MILLKLAVGIYLGQTAMGDMKEVGLKRDPGLFVRQPSGVTGSHRSNCTRFYGLLSS